MCEITGLWGKNVCLQMYSDLGLVNYSLGKRSAAIKIQQGLYVCVSTSVYTRQNWPLNGSMVIKVIFIQRNTNVF